MRDLYEIKLDVSNLRNTINQLGDSLWPRK